MNSLSHSCRSISKTGMDKSIRKNGGGAHNWGTPGDLDESEIFDNFDEDTVPPAQATANADSPIKDRRGSVSTASTSSYSEEDKEKAIAFRTKAFKDGSGTSLSLCDI